MPNFWAQPLCTDICKIYVLVEVFLAKVQIFNSSIQQVVGREVQDENSRALKYCYPTSNLDKVNKLDTGI